MPLSSWKDKKNSKIKKKKIKWLYSYRDFLFAIKIAEFLRLSLNYSDET